MEASNRSDGLVAVAANQLDPFMAHHHHLSEVGSPETRDSSTSCALANWGWFAFKHDHSPRLASVPTDCQPLLRSETSTRTSSNQTTLSGLGFSFTEKYGRCKRILHYGINSTIRLYETQASTPSSKTKQLLAVKVYRYAISDMTPVSPSQTVSSFSPTSVYSRHPNIVPILDLLFNERCELCVVMPYCAGGNLRKLVLRKGPLPPIEADCLFAQTIRAIAFLHSHAIAHLDVRLETIMLTAHGAIKLAGFGDKHIRRLWRKCAITRESEEYNLSPQRPHHRHWAMGFSLPWPLLGFPQRQPSSARSSRVIVRSSTASFSGFNRPYLPPEAFNRHSHGNICRSDEDDDNDDRRPDDTWAAAIVYMALITSRLPWSSACPQHEDSRYLEYLLCRDGEDGYPPIETLGKV